jgi:predicted component of type VI protein secretion system
MKNKLKLITNLWLLLTLLCIGCVQSQPASTPTAPPPLRPPLTGSADGHRHAAVEIEAALPEPATAY